jgi:hypothetical protein
MAALTCGHRRPNAQVILVTVVTRIKCGPTAASLPRRRFRETIRRPAVTRVE